MYRFSTRKQLPEKGKRNPRSSGEVFLPFEVNVSAAKGVEKMKEINLVMRGRSFDLKDLQKIPNPIYLVSVITPIERNRFINYIKN